MKVTTEQHIATARKLMPGKCCGVSGIDSSKESKQYIRAQKKARKQIAAVYRYYQNEHGHEAARIAHRRGFCTNGGDANYRLRQLALSENPAPAWR